MNKIYARMSIRFSVLLTSLFFVQISFGQSIERIDPPFWWVGMEHDTLELLVNGVDLSSDVRLRAEEVDLISAIPNANEQYVYVQLLLHSNTPAQQLSLIFGKTKIKYQLKKRETDNKALMGLTPADAMYLITPDRFANGNPKNDVVEGMKESTVDRSDPYGRHGGDLQGIFEHLDYINDLGFTALWLNPVLENDEFKASYHGYAITDHYKIDPRFGTHKEYKKLVDACHEKGIKMIMDVIYNHFGDQHYLLQNLPDSGWVNFWPSYTQTNFRATTLHDPYASKKDQELLKKGWFDKHMPDINQRNVHVKRYLIQNAIWWIEEFGIDAFRIDTYVYPDQEFMRDLALAIQKEYPRFFMFGETWVHGVQVQSFFVQKNAARADFNSNLQSVTDFQLAFAIQKGLKEKHGWAEGINRVYYTLSGDYMYANPENLVTFIDNHDIARSFGDFGQDLRKFKMAYALLLTTRGIPQVYYGTEILMKATEGHGEIREDFWGGWPEDLINNFSASGRTAEENEAFDYLQTLLQMRKTSGAIAHGTLMQFVPENGVYCYFRYTETEQVMVILNASEVVNVVDLSRFQERLASKSTLQNVFTGKKINIPKSLELAPFESLIFEVK